MTSTLEGWKWYSIKYTMWIDGVESAEVTTDVISVSRRGALNEFSRTCKYQHTVYSVVCLGTASEYFEKLEEYTSATFETEDPNT